MNLVDEQASKNKYLIFNESPKNDIMELLDKTIEENNKKSKVLIEILIYFFKIKRLEIISQ